MNKHDKEKLGIHKFNAMLPKTEDFKSRFEYGMEAQKLFLNKIKSFGITPLNTDFLHYLQNNPKIKKPNPDFEFDNCFIEVRRQDFFKTVFLGYSKKYNSWRNIAKSKKKPLYFCMISTDLKHIAYANLTENENRVFEQKNKGGDIDSCIPLDAFTITTYEKGMENIKKNILIKKENNEPRSLAEWM